MPLYQTEQVGGGGEAAASELQQEVRDNVTDST